MRIATVKNGIVDNVIIGSVVPTGGIASETAQIGDAVVNGVLVPKKPAPQAENYKVRATRLLSLSDVTVLRCLENGISVPAEWAAYRAALRDIMATGTGPLPQQPAYPAGT